MEGYTVHQQVVVCSDLTMKNRYNILLYGVILLVLAVGFVGAQGVVPGVPHKFFGSVADGAGDLAPDNLLVEAKIDGKLEGSTVTLNGYYGFKPPLYVLDQNQMNAGKKIEFYVNGILVGESVFVNGESYRLDFFSSEDYPAEVRPPVVEPPAGGGGGGGGGRGGGGGAPSGGPKGKLDVENLGDCTENWECSDWLDCVGSVQKRVCVEKNRCLTGLERPEESRDCNVEESSVSGGEKNFLSRILGAVTGVGGMFGAVGAVMFVLVIVIALLVVVRKRNEISKEKSVKKN